MFLYSGEKIQNRTKKGEIVLCFKTQNKKFQEAVEETEAFG